MRDDARRDLAGAAPVAAVALLPFLRGLALGGELLLPGPLAVLPARAPLRPRGPRRGRGPALEPLRPRGRPALASRPRLPDRPAAAPPPGRGGPLGRSRAPRAARRGLRSSCSPAGSRSAASPPRAARSSTPSAASCSRASTCTSTSRPRPGRPSSSSASCALARRWRASRRGRGGARPRRRPLDDRRRDRGAGGRRRHRGRRRESGPARSRGGSSRSRVGLGARDRGARPAPGRQPGRGQRAGPGLPDGRRARPLGPPLHARPDARGGALREPVERRRRVVGPELLPERASRTSSASTSARRRWPSRGRAPGPGTPSRAALIVLAALALVVCVGRWSGLAPLVDVAPALRLFRFPVKAFYTVHLGAALLAALGLSALAEARRGLRGGGWSWRPPGSARSWRSLRWCPACFRRRRPPSPAPSSLPGTPQGAAPTC